MNKILVGIFIGVALAALAYFFLFSGGVIHSLIPAAQKTKKSDEVCIQVVTSARNPKTGEIREFPTPCDVPDGWEPVTNDVPSLDDYQPQ